MSAPSGIRLQPGQLVIQPLTSSETGITPATPNTISQGVVVQAYSNQMSYSVDQNVSYSNKNAIIFNQGDVTYSIINQTDIFFMSTPL